MAPRFHKLTVSNVEKTIRDAVVVTLEPEDKTIFEFTQGQYLTLRRDFDGTELRRNYSICSSPDEDTLKIGIKQVEGGAFSTWANIELCPGMEIEAMPPAGRFFTQIDPSQSKSYIGFAGGSGITPILSILKTTLFNEPHSRFTLVYANRSVSSIMFREELEDLKNLYLERLNVIHVLEADSQDIDLFTGRLTPKKCENLFAHWIDLAAVKAAFICGPEPMMLTVQAALKQAGMPEDRIKIELFKSSQVGRLPMAVARQNTDLAHGEAKITLDGRTRTVPLPMDGTVVLDAANNVSMDAPYSCKAGVCSTCRAKLIKGEVEMLSNHALEDYEVRAGYILTCQAVPISSNLEVDYDQ